MVGRAETVVNRPVVLAALLVAATVAVFGQVVGHQFVDCDDDINIYKNPLIVAGNWDGVRQFWTEPYAGLYAPLTYTLFAAEAWVARRPGDPLSASAQFDPRLFHLGNLVLHVACVVLVFGVLALLVGGRLSGALAPGNSPGAKTVLVGDRIAAAGGAVLFALHPLQVESVSWVTETKGLLAAMFSLVALWQYVRFARVTGPETAESSTSKAPSSRTRAMHYALATVAYALALVSKPTAVAVPLIAAVLDYGWLRRRVWRVAAALLPWVALGAAIAVVTTSAQSTAHVSSLAPWWARPWVAADAVTFYMWKLIFPWNLAIDYGRTPARVIESGWGYAAWVIPCVVLALLARLADRRQWLVAAFVFLAALAPVLGLVPFGFQNLSTVADRYAYLALLGPALALAWWLRQYGTNRALAGVGLLALVLGAISFVQASRWRDTRALMEHVLRVNRRSYLAHSNLGFRLAADGDLDGAIQHYQHALRLHNFDHKEIHCDLGEIYRRLNRWDDAVRHYHAALVLDPSDTRTLIDVGNAYAARGEHAKAAQYFGDAVRAKPDFAEGHYNLGIALAAAGRPSEAIAAYRAAIRVRPAFAQAHHNLGHVLDSLGDSREAAREFRRAIDIEPRYAQAHANLAAILADERQGRQAEIHYRQALQLDPSLATAHSGLAMLLIGQSKLSEAAIHLREALRLRHDWPQMANNLAWILATAKDDRLRDAAEAIRLVEPICRDASAREATHLDTLAAAYAEAGRFDEAVAVAQTALEMALATQQVETAEKIRSRLELYRSGRPYRSG